jgi:quercetin dioxygenase-like cupin family protein
MPELKITHIDDAEWKEVKAQQHGDRRVSIWEKYLEWTPDLMVLYARYDPGMLTERHGHMSDHIVYVLEGEITVGEVRCRPGTNIVLEKGAVFGPIEAGPDGALLLEVMMGDPRSVPADPEGFAALLADRRVVPLPNPPFEAPSWFGKRTDSDLGAAP